MNIGFLGMGFGLFEIMFFIIFLLVIGILIISAVKGLGQWNKNNNSPRLTVEADIVAKRIDVQHHHHGSMADNTGHIVTSTSYYVTFQVDSGDRMELEISGNEYGMLVEGDRGRLTFQGTRYLGFERQ